MNTAMHPPIHNNEPVKAEPVAHHHTSAPAEAAPTPTKAPVAAKRRSSNLKLKPTGKLTTAEDHYCLTAIVDVLNKAGATKPYVTADEMVAGLDAKKLKSKQASARILSYWKKTLLTGGYATTVTDEGTTDEATSEVV